MDKYFNYAGLFDQALSRIKSIRDPRATKPETSDLRWKDVADQVIFKFIGNDLSKYYNVSQSANEISMSCICFMIIELLKRYNYTFHQLDVKDAEGLAKAFLHILDSKSKTLLLFKELEECPLWKIKDSEPEEVRKIMDSYGATSCKYIYLVYDNAYLQIIGHNDNENDPGRGYNVYSLKWFFETYFGTQEYFCFEKSVKKYIQDVKNCIGYHTVKTLTPGSLINFRKLTENEIFKYPYDKLVNVYVKNYSLESNEINKLKIQFFELQSYLGLLGINDYAESLITAEWLYDSMKKAQSIDLTIIGMGYFKTVEQLLFEMICLHKNEGREIKKDYSRKDLETDKIELNDSNIDDKSIDTTIGSMAVFYRDNLNMLRGDLTWRTKKYILETIFKYKDLRNGYFHKDNIHEMERIDVIRNSTFELLFLLLGSHNISDGDKKTLGFPTEINSDYYKLCEYVNYHHGELFYLDFGKENEKLASGYYDAHSKLVDDNYIGYTGVYFKELGKNGRIVPFTEAQLPEKISLGKFVFGHSDGIEITPVKLKTVFEKGKFIGPLIAEEELDY